MNITKDAILHLSPEEKRQLAFDLLDSIDEEFMEKPVSEWKELLIKQRIDIDKENPSNSSEWNEIRKKYFGK